MKTLANLPTEQGSALNYQNPDLAFKNAIEMKRLSADPAASNYAGMYMYMGTDQNDNDLFKNINTRSYLLS